MDNLKGHIVRSKAGRDKGDIFIVLDVQDNYAYIANGILRKVDRPKKKKLMHLQCSDKVSDVILQKIDSSEEITDSMVRKALAEYSQN